jgi:hypothetical protein
MRDIVAFRARRSARLSRPDDDRREEHRQIFEGDETIDYAFMGQDPDAADNRWLREAFENRIPIIYFLGIAPGRYQAMLPAFISGWDAKALKARVAFGVLDEEALAPPETALERRYGLRIVKQRLHQARSVKLLFRPTTAAARFLACQNHFCSMPAQGRSRRVRGVARTTFVLRTASHALLGAAAGAAWSALHSPMRSQHRLDSCDSCDH